MCKRAFVDFVKSLNPLHPRGQLRCRTVLSVLLYLDIKNAFHAVNHHAIFIILDAYRFSASDLSILFVESTLGLNCQNVIVLENTLRAS